MGRCYRGSHNVCAYRGNFHISLANLGKTNLSDDELLLFPERYRKDVKPVKSPHKVFLYDVSQLSDPENESTFLNDLQSFLHLREPIPPMIWFRPGKNLTSTLKKRRDVNKIDICDYDELRAVLLDQAKGAVAWFKNYFLHSPDVMVSSPNQFISTILESWLVDPCVERKATKE